MYFKIHPRRNSSTREGLTTSFHFLSHLNNVSNIRMIYPGVLNGPHSIFLRILGSLSYQSFVVAISPLFLHYIRQPDKLEWVLCFGFTVSQGYRQLRMQLSFSNILFKWLRSVLRFETLNRFCCGGCLNPFFL